MRSKKLKILIIGSLPPPFIGPYIATKSLIESRIIREKLEASFLDISDVRNLQNIGKFDLWNVYLAFVHITRFLFLIISRKPNVVYFNISQGIWGYLRDLGFLIPSILLKKRVVLHLRGSEFREFYSGMPPILKWITRALLARVARIIVLARNLRSIFDGLVEPYRIEVIPNGIDYSQFNLYPNVHSTPRNGRLKILFLSSLRKRKGIFEFLQSIPYVLQKHSEACFTVAGEWRDDTEKLKATSFISEKHLDEYVDFVGQISGAEKVTLYLAHSIFVFPPIEPEGLPWVVLEAMSAALPVISTDQGAISEVVEDGKTGFIVEPKPEIIAEKICYLIENPAIAKRMGYNGRKRVEDKYSEKKYHERLVKLLREAATEPLNAS